MKQPHSMPVRVPAEDKTTRQRAAAVAAKAYIGSLTWWGCLIVFAGISAWITNEAWKAHLEQSGAGVITFYIGIAALAAGFAIFYVPLAMAFTIHRAPELYYLDTGTARAAMATRPDERRGALSGDVQAHSFGAWPKGARVGQKTTGTVLGEWVRDHVHAHGGRLTGTALPGMAKKYLAHGMVDDGRIAGVLVRVASQPRPEPNPTPTPDHTTSKKNHR